MTTTYGDLPLELRVTILSYWVTLAKQAAFTRRCLRFEQRHCLVIQRRMRKQRVHLYPPFVPTPTVACMYAYHSTYYTILECGSLGGESTGAYYSHRAHVADDAGCIIYNTKSDHWGVAIRRPLTVPGQTFCPKCSRRLGKHDSRADEARVPERGQPMITEFFSASL
jgi:hypothetical protein